MNILEARRRLLDGEIKKRTAEGENISVRSVSRMRPALALYGKSEQETTTGAQLLDLSKASGVDDNAYIQISDIGVRFEYSEQDENSRFITFPCELKAGQSYICTAERSSSDIVLYLSQFSQYLAFGNPFVPEQDADSITIYVNASASKGMYKVDYIMLNTGTAALPWEPYTSGAPSPSPDYPQEIKSVGDSGAINVTLSDGGSQSQTLPVQTPNGLPGIPVSSGGNYTDANGQQWICDEVDFKRGVYVQRVGLLNKDIQYNFSPNPSNDELSSQDNSVPDAKLGFRCLCSHFSVPYSTRVQGRITIGTAYRIWISNPDNILTGDTANQIVNSDSFKLYYQLETNIEIPLSPSELAAYSALRTYSLTTVVSNDAGAWMKLGYKTKKSLEVID